MKVIQPSPLVIEAARVLAAVHDQVVVVGAAAIEIALADSTSAITPTRDVDVVIPTERATAIVTQLERAGLRRSDLPHEAAFTWVRGDLKIQLVCGFHPFPSAEARRLPHNPVFAVATESTHQDDVAFAHAPTVRRLRAANAACLLALKQAAFGRRRAEADAIVQRDYHDAYLLIDAAANDIVTQMQVASHEVRTRVLDALARHRRQRHDRRCPRDGQPERRNEPARSRSHRPSRSVPHATCPRPRSPWLMPSTPRSRSSPEHEWISVDRDFARLPDLRWRHPHG